MKPFSLFKKSHGRALAIALFCLPVFAVSGCSDEDAADPKTQIGPHPDLPAIKQYLFPPINIAPVVGWKEDEKPWVPPGLQIQALRPGSGIRIRSTSCRTGTFWLLSPGPRVRNRSNGPRT